MSIRVHDTDDYFIYTLRRANRVVFYVGMAFAGFEVLRGFGIRLYGKGEDDHEWECEVGEIKGGNAGYGSFADALRAALEWRIEQG